MNERTIFYLALGLFVLLLALSILLHYLIKTQPAEIVKQDLIPDGEIPSKTLFSEKYKLVGKPDIILKKGTEYFPVEVKSSAAKNKPYPSHILQLAAYCLLIEEHYGTHPSYGILRYKNREFKIPYTKELRSSLLTQIKSILNTNPEKQDLPPLCENIQKCRHCGYAWYCRMNQKHLF